MPDDQLLPERLVEERRRSSYVLLPTYVIVALLGGWHLLWTLPLTVVLLTAADYPARRQIYGETWSLFTYLWFWFRWSAALGAFWLLLALTPWLIRSSGSYAVAASALAAVTLIAWNRWFGRIFLVLFGARRLDDPDWLEAFQPVADKASVPPPGVWIAETAGGFVPTAFALPAVKGGGVLFLRPLLDRLPQREAVAVFAHEVAHLEQYTPRVLRVLEVVTLALIATAVLLPHIVAATSPERVTLAVSLWPFGVLGLLLLRTRLQKPLELEGDRRAAELCADPEAVASGLMRLYAMARMPRRIDVEVERWATHPSLARRVQALRALAGSPAEEAITPLTFVSVDPEGVVTFDVEGLRVAGTVAAYRDLHELRLELRGGSKPQLISRDRSGRVQRIDMRDEDAPAVQAMLDRVDGLLAPELPSGPALAIQRASVLAAGAAIVALFWASTLSVFAVASLAAIRASVPTLSAAAVATMGGGAIAWWAGGTRVDPAALVLIGFGLVLMFVALRGRAVEPDRPHRLVMVGAIVVLSVLTVVTWLLAGVGFGSALRLHRAVAASPGLVVFPWSLAALLAAHSTRRLARARLAAVAFAVTLAAVGLVPLLAATPMFFARFVRDPLIRPAPRFPVVAGLFEAEHRFRLDANFADVRLSPSGGWISAAAYEEDGDADRTPYTLLARDGRRFHLRASEIAFLDDEHVIVVEEDEKGLRLSIRRLAFELPVIRSERLPDFGLARLDVSPARRTWRMWGWGERGEAVRLEGSTEAAGFVDARWSTADAEQAQGLWFVSSGPHAVRLEEFDQPSVLGLLAEGNTRLAGRGYRRIAVVDASGAARLVPTELRTTCLEPAIGATAVTCAAFDGGDTRFFELAEGIDPLAIVSGTLWPGAQHEDGTITAVVDGEHVLVQPKDRRVVRLSDGGDDWFEMTYSAGRVAMTTFADESGAVVEVGRLVVR